MKMGLALATLVLLATLLGIFAAKYQRQEAPPAIPGLLWPEPRVLAPFTAVDHENQPYSLIDLQGKWSFLFFGYTHCPDICPITLAIMDKVHKQLNPDIEAQTVFVSVDPERDTPVRLGRYVTYFNPEFIGLGGSVEQITDLAGQLNVAYYLDKQEPGENYLVDHSASLFLIDPELRLVSVFSAPHDAVAIAERFNRIRDFFAKASTI